MQELMIERALVVHCQAVVNDDDDDDVVVLVHARTQ